MLAVKSEITLFSNHVREKLDGLATRGEKSLDIIAYLFKGYEECIDSKFANFFKCKCDTYEEDDAKMTPEELMTAHKQHISQPPMIRNMDEGHCQPGENHCKAKNSQQQQTSKGNNKYNGKFKFNLTVPSRPRMTITGKLTYQ